MTRVAVLASGRTLFRSLPAERRATKVTAIEQAFADVGIT